MKVEILRNTRAGGESYAPGDKPTLSERDANTLVLLGKAQYVSKDKKKKAEPLSTENAGGLVSGGE